WHAALGGGGGRLRVGKRCAGAFDRDLKVARVEFEQGGTVSDLAVVFDIDLLDRAANARRNLSHVRIDLRIIGGFTAGGDPEPHKDAGYGENEHASGDADAWIVEQSHQRVPPMSCRNVFSDDPT